MRKPLAVALADVKGVRKFHVHHVGRLDPFADIPAVLLGEDLPFRACAAHSLREQASPASGCGCETRTQEVLAFGANVVGLR